MKRRFSPSVLCLSVVFSLCLFQNVCNAGTTSLLDISNWTVFFGKNAGMNNGLLTVGTSSAVRSKQTYYQPMTFTWKGWFPLTNYSGNGAGIIQPPFDINGYPYKFGYSFYADWVHPNALVINNTYAGVASPIINVPNVSISGGYIYGEYTMSWQNNIVSFYYNGIKVYEQSYVSSDPIYLYFSSSDTYFKIESISVTTPTNGACGAANGTTVTIAPTTNLCTSGTASTVTGSGPWNWSCSGSNGGTTATCSANLQAPITSTTPSITWRHQGDGKVSGTTTNGSSITGGAQFYQETNQAWSIVGQGDFDGDGVKDLVWWNSSTGQVYLMLMSSPTTVKSGTAIYTEPNTNWRIVATGDINGDGMTDLIWWNKTTGQVYAMQISGTTVTQGGIIYTEPDTDWKIVAAADFNGNGRAELLWWNTVAGKVAIGQTNGTNAATATVIWLEPDTSWRIAGAGDLDGDGKADIVWHNKTTGQVYGMQTNGSSVTNGAMMYTEPNTLWEIVSVGNYNGDNKAELLWWNQQTGQVSLMPMNGLVVSGAVSLYTEPDTTWRIQGETEWRDNLYGKGVTTTTK